MKILVTGGCGFLGSHTCCELLNNNYEVVVVDNLTNSRRNIIERIKKITGKELQFYDIDLCDRAALKKVFDENDILAVIHLAGSKGLDNANKNPLAFYKNNVEATISLVDVMSEYNCKKLVFGSSAMVYGNKKNIQIKEDTIIAPENILGETKAMSEKMLKELYANDNTWSIAILRYFNPAGAHESGLLGEAIEGMPRTLLPRLVKVATGDLSELDIYGNDYDTEDGTARRDYTHVCDIAKAHVIAIEKVLSTKEIDCYNLGTGYSHSVLDVIHVFEKVNNVQLNYSYKENRLGDAPVLYANPEYTMRKLGWQAEKDLGDICEDSYNYIMKQYLDKEEDEDDEQIFGYED